MATIPGAAGPGAPFPQWTVILGGSQIIGEVSNAYTKAGLEADAWPATVYFFTSKLAAQNFANSHGGSAQEGALAPAVSGGQSVLNAAGSAAGDAVNAANAVPDFLSRLSSRALWVRIAEGVLGVALILVAIAELGKGTPVGNAVKKVPLIF